MIRIERFAASIDKLSNKVCGVDGAISRSVAGVAKIALANWKATSAFRNRTGALRAAFQLATNSFAANQAVVVRIDPLASPRSGVTPPNTYGRFVNYGTKFMAARNFETPGFIAANLDGRDAVERIMMQALK